MYPSLDVMNPHKSKVRDSNNYLTAGFLSSNYQLILHINFHTSVCGAASSLSLTSFTLLPSLCLGSSLVHCNAIAPILSPLLTHHLPRMIGNKVAEVILGGLALLSCFVIKGLTCWRELLCSELLNRLFLPGDRPPTSFSISLYFLMNHFCAARYYVRKAFVAFS